MAQHTPGPWTLKEDRTIWGPNGRFVADLNGRDLTPTDEANAKLMAASPALLDALSDALFLMATAGLSQRDEFRAGMAAVSQATA